MEKKPLIIGSDHAGYELKNRLVPWMQKKGISVEDAGVNAPTAVDYPDIGYAVAIRVADGRFARGILLCGTGVGMSCVANKVKGIRAGLCGDSYTARSSREHNDTNILVLGARVIGDQLAMEIVETWLNTSFLGDRHQRRVEKIHTLTGR